MNLDFNSFPLLATFLYVLDWIIRIGSIFIVPKNRKPSSATAWLMLIMFFPLLGFLVFLFIGSPKLPRHRRKMQRTMDKIIAEYSKDSKNNPLLSKYLTINTIDRYKPFINLNQNLGGLPAFQGNQIILIDNYLKSIASIAKDIDQAKKFIHIEYFAIAYDKDTKIFFDAIESAVKRGVKVRLLFDSLGSRKYPNFKLMKKELTRMGVEWHPMLPLNIFSKNFTRPDLRNHRKIVVIDGLIGYTGSQNIIQNNYHRKDDLYYEELVARISGPIALQLNAAFTTDWYSETKVLLEHINNDIDNQKIKSYGDTIAQVLPSGPGYDNFNNLKLFTSLIHSANKKIVITNPYFVPDDSLMTAITSAAQRNVEVIMINSKIMDQGFVGNAQRSYYEELLKSGVKIYQYKWPILLHSKHMTIDDDIAVIGSSNLDMRSFQLDLEVTLVAYDKQVVKDLAKIQVKNIKNSKLLSLYAWQKRPHYTKLKENIARLTAALQ